MIYPAVAGSRGCGSDGGDIELVCGVGEVLVSCGGVEEAQAVEGREGFHRIEGVVCEVDIFRKSTSYSISQGMATWRARCGFRLLLGTMGGIKRHRER